MLDRELCPITGTPMDRPGLCGTTLDRYAVELYLGGGGFGAVYQARHTIIGRKVALKVLHERVSKNEEVLERFFREARAAAAIGSQHIVQVYDAGLTRQGYPFLAMELIEGCSLKQLAEVGPLSVGRAVGIVLQVLQALSPAHRAGIVHRDIKPGNIMLEGTTLDHPASGRDFAKLVDFGISKFKTGDLRELTKSGATIGSPGYAAPEQYLSARRADHRTDLYSLSVTLYRLLCGRLPFDGETYESMVVQVCTSQPRPLSEAAPHLPRGLCAAVDKGISREPDLRWETAGAMARALTEYATTTSDAPVPPPRGGSIDGFGPTAISAPLPAAAMAPDLTFSNSRSLEAPKMPTVPRWAWGAWLAFVVVVSGIGVWVWAGRSTAPPPPPPKRAAVVTDAELEAAARKAEASATEANAATPSPPAGEPPAEASAAAPEQASPEEAAPAEAPRAPPSEAAAEPAPPSPARRARPPRTRPTPAPGKPKAVEQKQAEPKAADDETWDRDLPELVPFDAEG